jgi:DNA-directed RNA polymerase beta subunit
MNAMAMSEEVSKPASTTAVKVRKSRAKPSAGAISTQPGSDLVKEHAAKEVDKEVVKEVTKEVTKEVADLDESRGVLSHLGDYIDEPYTVIESYFRGQHLERLVRHQIESYNHFIQYQAQRTIQMFNPVLIHSENDYVSQYDKYLLEISVSFHNFKLHPPQIHENNGATKTMFPQEAKLRNFTYASAMTIDIHIDYIIRNTENMDSPRIISKILPKINIGKMPIMLKSAICVLTQNQAVDAPVLGECAMDCGGYFIIKGSEKTVLGQERAAENRVYCYYGKNTTKWSWYAEIKSIPDFKCISPKQIEMMISSRNNGVGHPIYVQIPRIRQPIELFAVFRALGILTDRAICEYILQDVDDPANRELLEALQASVIDANKYATQETALRHITTYAAYTPAIHVDKERGGKRKQEFTMEVLTNDLFPHCRTPTQRLYMLGHMCRKLLQTSLGWLPPNDRDSYLNKRIELTGTLLNNLFRNYFNKMVKEMQKQVVREINNGSWRSTDNYEVILNMTNIYKIIKSTTIENGINRALSTGDFSIKESSSSKVGVAQVLSRLTYLSSLSHLRRINTPLEKSGELIAPRKLHNTTFGYLCCLTGDAEILLGNRTDLKQIRHIRDGDLVNTVHRKTLQDQSSTMHNYFSKMPDRLFEITTVSGRTIKATDDHPFLVNVGDDRRGRYEMIKLCDLREGDQVVVRHTVKMIPDQHTTVLIVPEQTVLECYREELRELDLLNHPLPLNQVKAVARLLGANVNTSTVDHMYNYDDMHQMAHDIGMLNFKTRIYDLEMVSTWCMTIRATQDDFDLDIARDEGAFAHFMQLVGMKEIKENRSLPEWLLGAEPSVKREFLSACPRVHCVSMVKVAAVPDLVKYMNPIADMLNELGVECDCEVSLSQDTAGRHDWRTVAIYLKDEPDNWMRFYDTIGHTYCEERRCDAARHIEFAKIRAFSGSTYDDDGHTAQQSPLTVDNGCVSVSIASIREIDPEPVYDFTTYSDNHSFVASSFVVSNCAESPEGQSIGVVKNISYLTHITVPTHSTSLYEYVTPHILAVEACHDCPSRLHGKVRVFINGAWVGVTDTPQELYHDLKDKKYQGIIQIYTSIVFDYRNMEIRICNDGGRMTRPVLKVRENRVLLTRDVLDRLERHELGWNDLLVSTVLPESVLEYIDPEEQNYAMIAMKSKQGYLHPAGASVQYTHCEIHPSTIFGVLASCIPFPEHNQSPRNTYQSCMCKQAIGIYALNFDKRMDKTAYVLNYPSRPLVDTRLMNYLELNRIPSGHQVIVAIASITSYNQEDSILMNQGSVDRGLFATTIYHTEKDEDKNIIRDEIIRCRPDPQKTKGIKYGNYSKLNAQGFMPENTYVENRDVIVAKIVPIKENRNDPTKTIKYEDQSKTYRTTEESYIDQNYTGRNGDGYNFAKVRVRTFRKPVIGDKFASRSAQKGTCGLIIPEADMPFTKEGLRPDIILNPHAIPSRMTIAQLKETLLGKVLIQLGMFGDATSFGNNLSVDAIIRELQRVGYESYGNEVMYDGMSGKQLETSIFIGPVFYQRLKHMVNDKQHSRAIGPMVNLTRQPAEGRSRDGGFRIGEMERDVMIAHGMSRFCRERLYDVSDKYTTHVCNRCGLMAAYNDPSMRRVHPTHAGSRSKNDMSVHLCRTCGNTTDFSRVEIPYAYKLLSQELMTMNICPRILTE